MNTSNITNYKPKDFAELLEISVKILQRWGRDGIMKAKRTPTNRRYYTYDQYLQFQGINTENDQRLFRYFMYFPVGLYGLRKYKKQIERDGEIAKELQNGD